VKLEDISRKEKHRQYLKDKINELATGSKNKNIGDLYRGIIESKKGYKSRTNVAKYEKDVLMQILGTF
jgi:hypothetical protein